MNIGTIASPLRELLTKWLLEQVPTTGDTFGASVVRAVLDRLSLFTLFSCPVDRATTERLAFYRTCVDLAPKTLHDLATATFPTSNDIGNAEADEDEFDFGFVKTKMSQRQRKGGKAGKKKKAAGVAVVFDWKAFDAMGLGSLVPTCRSVADCVVQRLLHDQTVILKVRNLIFGDDVCVLTGVQYYFNLLRGEDIATSIIERLVRQQGSEEAEMGVAGGRADDCDEVALSTAEVPSAFPMVQPMKACVISFAQSS